MASITNKPFIIMIFVILIVGFVILFYNGLFFNFLIDSKLNSKSDIPAPLIELAEYASLIYKNETNAYGKFLIIPEYYGLLHQPTWFRGDASEFWEYYSGIPTIPTRANELRHPYLYGVSFRDDSSLIMRNDMEGLSKFLSKWNIKYLVVHGDIHPVRGQAIPYFLDKSKSFEKVFSNSLGQIFMNKNCCEIFKTNNEIILSLTGLAYLSSLSYVSDNSSLVFLYQNGDLAESIYEYADYFLTDKSNPILDLVSYTVPKNFHIIPSHNNNEKETKWEIGYLPDPHHAAWHPLVLRMPIHDWDYPYKNHYGFIITENEEAKISLPIKIDEDGNYMLLGRILKSSNGGSLGFEISNLSKSISTKTASGSEFEWQVIGKVFLKKDNHILHIFNIEGINAINFALLLPEEILDQEIRKIEEYLHEKTIIYIFEGERDFERQNNVKIKKFSDASNGGILEFLDETTIVKKIEILKNGNYKLAMLGKGNFEINLANKTIESNSDANIINYYSFDDLTKGSHELAITASKNSYLDVVWIYSVDKTLEELFEKEDKSAKIEFFEKNDPTSWNINIKANEPFILNFAESYDPAWEARILAEGKPLQIIKPVALNGITNGFLITDTGNLDIELKYKTQDRIDISLITGTIAFLAILSYFSIKLLKSMKKE